MKTAKDPLPQSECQAAILLRRPLDIIYVVLSKSRLPEYLRRSDIARLEIIQALLVLPLFLINQLEYLLLFGLWHWEVIEIFL